MRYATEGKKEKVIDPTITQDSSSPLGTKRKKQQTKGRLLPACQTEREKNRLRISIEIHPVQKNADNMEVKRN